MKKTLYLAIVALLTMTMLAACVSSPSTPPADPTQAPAAKETTPADTKPAETAEIVDGKFTKTRKITVEIYDRSNEGGSPPEDNFYTDFIKEGMLRDHNVEVEFIPVPRWTEVDVLNNLLAAGDAPDICVTYSYPTIQSYANMGGVLDMAPLLEANR